MSKQDTLMFNPETLEWIEDADSTSLNDIGIFSFSTLISVKASDVINNLSTLHGLPLDKISRKVAEAAIYMRPLVQKYASVYWPALQHWISYWQRQLEKSTVLG